MVQCSKETHTMQSLFIQAQVPPSGRKTECRIHIFWSSKHKGHINSCQKRDATAQCRDLIHATCVYMGEALSKPLCIFSLIGVYVITQVFSHLDRA
ncbi:hypothetical protein GDO78_011466 [Eleutherodactylus coqui]|uniref:Uncharacterized protein n=1 Tax=Eleutherodactylus coqui TaxID=57060 RepID=A0A8J6KBP3_ELECQ|nr:hypothetical protein GDO78_011466 [Eleutherodactylus coqui]